jgi:hypothetical protein
MSEHGDCECCGGVDAETPRPLDGAPGLSRLTYRVGEHATFKQTMLARLSASDLPALAGLTTRDDSDFTIAFVDGVATVLDVLTFYQERLANEHYLRSAVERRSVLELSRLIGYELSPGVAASTYLAFTLQDAPGAPSGAAAPVTLSIGTRVQSVPGPGEQPQTFETVEPLGARVEWNAIPAQVGARWMPQSGDKDLYLGGVSDSLQVGDAILIVGRERLVDPGSERWDVRLVTSVERDAQLNRTRIAWNEPLGSASPPVAPTGEAPRVFVFRQRAALFGHNAPDPRLLGKRGSNLTDLVSGSGVNLDWKDFEFDATGPIDLDAAYPKIAPGSWFALVSNQLGLSSGGLPGYVELYRAGQVSFPSRRDFGLSGKVTRLSPDTHENLDRFRRRLRECLVLAQSEALPVAERPLQIPVHGDELSLGALVSGLEPNRALAVSGKAQRIVLKKNGLSMILTGSGQSVALSAGDSLRLAAPPELSGGGGFEVLSPEQFGARLSATLPTTLRLSVLDRDGRAAVALLPSTEIALSPALKEDPVLEEIASIGGLPLDVTHDRDRTHLRLAAPLAHSYDRASVRVNANVARATHGETVNEVLGDGNAAQRDQAFALKHSPLTWVSAATPSGRASTLQLRANDLLWQDVPSLFGREPSERVYVTRVDDDGHGSVRFGDGMEGSRLPTGSHNIRASYRKGLGVPGNVGAGKLTNLLTRPLGLQAAHNPLAASGGADPETLSQAQRNAPLTVLTLERAVSVRDYRDFARSFAGIAKAHAAYVPNGAARGVFLTVAGERGAPVLPSGDTYGFLVSALRAHGDPLMPISVVSYRSSSFRLRASVKVKPDAETDAVLSDVIAALLAHFDFEARDFGQGVSVDEVLAVAQALASVEAVQVVELHRTDEPLPVFVPRLRAALPVAELDAVPDPAEVLSIAPEALVIEAMP